MIFLNPLDALIPKIPFSLFLPIFGSRSPPRPGVSLGRILGVLSIDWSSQGAVSTPPPLQLQGRLPLGCWLLPRGHIMYFHLRKGWIGQDRGMFIRRTFLGSFHSNLLAPPPPQTQAMKKNPDDDTVASSPEGTPKVERPSRSAGGTFGPKTPRAGANANFLILLISWNRLDQKIGACRPYQGHFYAWFCLSLSLTASSSCWYK